MSNEPITMSSFGMFTNECAFKFCKDKDGLNLWLSFINDCFYESSEPLASKSRILLVNTRLNTPLFSAFICSSVGLVCFMMSYIITKKLFCKIVKKNIEIKNKK
jgi:hypothetical protein